MYQNEELCIKMMIFQLKERMQQLIAASTSEVFINGLVRMALRFP